MSRTSATRSSTSVGQRRTAGFSTSRRSGARLRHAGRARRTQAGELPQHHPARLLEQWEPTVGFEVRLGRTQLERLAPESRLAVADSAFNQSELIAAGYRHTDVVPLLIDMTSAGEPPDPPFSPAWATTRPVAVRTCSSSARSRRTRRRTTWSRCCLSTGASTTPRPGCGWLVRPSASAMRRPSRPSSKSSGSRTRSPSPARSPVPSSSVPGVRRRLRLRVGPRGLLCPDRRGHGP